MASVPSDVDWQSTKKTVLERNSHMFNNSDMSDISFTCEGSDKTFYAHKYVLATSSAVFNAMFYGDLAEKNSVVHLSDTDEKGLEEFLRFLYTDECNLTTENVMSVMYLSKKYIVPSLTEYVKAQLVRDMEPANVLDILEQVIHFEEKYLEMKCWQVIEWRASEVASSANFINIKQATLASLLKRNNLTIPEVELFQAVLKWIDHQCSQKSLELTTENRRSVVGEAVYDLRFIGMNQQEFAKHVSKSGLLIAEELVPIYETFSKVESPLLKWKLPEREKTFKASNKIIRISRFSAFSKNESSSSWQYSGHNASLLQSQPQVNQKYRDYLSFSVDQCALFLGVRLFAASKVRSGCSNTYQVGLTVNAGQSVNSGTNSVINYVPDTKEHGITGFDVMLKSPILVKENEVVRMDAGIVGPPSHFGSRGKPIVKEGRITVKFLDSSDSHACNARTCVSQGQFHQIILSV
jgi:BTB/POZ domain-containing protein 3/6